MKQQLLDNLSAHGQQQLLRFWDELEPAGQESLATQIEALNLPLLTQLFRQEPDADAIRAMAAHATSPPAIRLDTARNRFTPEEARRCGQEALAAGEVAGVLVAGGQGTRLGFDRPKVMYPIGPVSQHTLAQILIEKLLAVSARYGVGVPLAVMTSPATDAPLRQFFAESERFGLPEDELLLICQGVMPAVDAETGKVLLAAKDQIALSPDGHGGMLAAITGSGVLDALARRGIRTLFYFQVDNPLVQFGSPEFLGYHRLAGSDLSTQVIAKQSPTDRVGNVVEVDGRLQVIEYSDMPDDVAQRRAPDGSLAIWAGSIAVHLMDVSFLQRMAGQADALPFHRAHKKVAHLAEDGQLVTPSAPNALKFERFIFDLIPSARNALVVEIDPAQGFAPLKNAPGAPSDTPETVRAAMIAEHGRWLAAAGAELREGVQVEISPLVALDAEMLAAKVAPGTQVTRDTYLHPPVAGCRAGC
ncbi:MAG: UTP--glucose-1-phosphate uridylyltransferase [Patescibacteria group bacterium]|nr:UTP--glucose-1-phosphate uridylyltransferase [Patescibacteria group bacterium]